MQTTNTKVDHIRSAVEHFPLLVFPYARRDRIGVVTEFMLFTSSDLG